MFFLRPQNLILGHPRFKCCVQSCLCLVFLLCLVRRLCTGLSGFFSYSFLLSFWHSFAMSFLSFLRANSPSSIPFLLSLPSSLLSPLCLFLTLFYFCCCSRSIFVALSALSAEFLVLFPASSSFSYPFQFSSLISFFFSFSGSLFLFVSHFFSLLTLRKPSSLIIVFLSFSRCSSFVLLSLVYCSFRFWRESRKNQTDVKPA